MQGLTKTQVRQALEKYGKNILQAEKSNPWWKMLFSQFTDLLVIILLLSALISFGLAWYEGTGDIKDGIVIIFIVILNAGIGFFQEFRTEKTLEALKKMVHPEIRVTRDGKEQLIQTEELVPGDIVILGEGDKIPADGKIIISHSLKIEESALTGESLPVEKKEKQEAFMGTSVVHGSGVMEIMNTGMSTKFGEIARLTTETVKVKSPLQKEMETMGVFVTKLTLFVCIILFGIKLFRDLSGAETMSITDTVFSSLMYSVSVAIAAVPEGLPTTITIALAMGAAVLVRRKALVKKLSAVETLGAVTTICSDKTGTLTKNEMTVREIYLSDQSKYNISGVGYDSKIGSIQFAESNDDHKETNNNKVLLRNLLEICYYCNEAKLAKKDGKSIVLGDPTEGALLTLAEKSKEKSFIDNNSEQKNLDEIFPFDSDRKMMSVVKEDKVLAKGSPDQILEKCTHWSDGEKIHKITSEKLSIIQEHYTLMAKKALRVLAFAYQPISNNKKITNHEIAEDNLVFIGLSGMIDPPREEVKNAIEQCSTAGVRVIVITGDYGVTAEAIASELGITKNKEVQVLTGSETKLLSDEKLSNLLKNRNKSVIFARSLPVQKMRIVRLLQEQGEIVAMTGDGVNDAPALKKADIGVAMGITGTEVSKEAATMILTNDSFATIVKAIEEGRRIYQNLKKFVWFIFSCNIGELFVIFAAILFALPLPLTAILILCVDLGTDILPAIALGVDDAEKDVMKKPPRDPKQKVLQKSFILDFLFIGIIIGISVLGVFLYALSINGWHWSDDLSLFDKNNPHLLYAQTIAFATLVMIQLVNVFSARSETVSVFRTNPFSNKFLVIAVLSSIFIVLGIVYLLNFALDTKPLTLTDWMIIMVASFIPLVIIEIRKFWRRKKSSYAL